MPQPTPPRPADVDPCDEPDHGHRSLQLHEARERILAAVKPVEEREMLPLREALDRVLAEPVRSTVNVPAHDNSAWTGLRSRESR